jgi:FkbM family methyltransferase
VTYRIALPAETGNRTLDIIDGSSSAVQRALRRAGIAEFEPTTVSALLAVFETAGDCLVFFDIGANVGLYSAMCSSMFDPDLVVAFEPTPATADIARAIFDRNRLKVDVVQAAVGQSAGRASLYLSATSDASNSMVKGFKRNVGTVDVDVVSIDQLVADGLPSPTVIKIDVESFEADVLKGALKTIYEHRPIIVIEVLKRRGYDHGPDIEAQMASLGYTYYRLGPKPAWKPRRHIVGKPGTVHRDWLLTPVPLDDSFRHSFDACRVRVGSCTADRNGRLPLAGTIKATLVTHGWGTLPFLARLALKRSKAVLANGSVRRKVNQKR